MTTPKSKYVQFAHIEGFAPGRPQTTHADKSKRSDGSDMRWTTSDVLDEATREKGCIPHIMKPMPPTWHIGSRVAVEERVAAWHSTATKDDGSSKRQITSPAMACAVVSLSRDLIDSWPDYRDRLIAFFTKKYGDRLVGLVEHLDEAHPHIHVYLVDVEGEKFSVHPGLAAARIARNTKGNHSHTAFKVAVRAWLEELYAEVSEPFGLQRLGVKRRRVPRIEHLANKAAAELIELTEANSDAATKDAAKKAAAIEAAAHETAQRLIDDALSRVAGIDSNSAEQITVATGATTEASKAKAAALEAIRMQQWAKTKFDETSAGHHAAEIAALKAQLAAVKTDLAATSQALNVTKTRLEAHEAKRPQSVVVEFNAHGLPTNAAQTAADAFANSAERATMRTPAKASTTTKGGASA